MEEPVTPATPEPLEALPAGPDPVKFAERARSLLRNATYRTDEKDRIEKARKFFRGDEYKFASTTNLSGTRLQLKDAKKLVTRDVASVCRRPMKLRVRADQLPTLPPDHPFRGVQQQMAQALVMRGDDEAGLVGGMLTHALDTYCELLDIDSKTERLVELSEIDGVCYLKDGVDSSTRDVLTVDLVQSAELVRDPTVFLFADSRELCHMLPPMTRGQFMALFPDLDPDDYRAQDEKTVKPSTMQDGGKGDSWHVEEHWQLLDEGVWARGYRCGDRALPVRVFADEQTYALEEVVVDPFGHGRHPFHQLVGETDPTSAGGMSFVLDLVYDLAVADNKSLSAAIHNLELTGNNKRLINPDAVENAGDLANSSIANVVLKPGKTFAEAVAPVQGQSIADAFERVRAMLDAKLLDIAAPPAYGGNGEQGESYLTGSARVDLLRKRTKRCLQSLGKNLIHNLVSFVPGERSFRVAGGLGSEYLSFNPAIFQDVLGSFDARFTLTVDDEEIPVTDPVQAATIQNAMLKAAAEAQQATGIKMSTYLSAFDFPNKHRFIEAVRAQELQQEMAAAAAAASGQGNPQEMAAQAQMRTQRGEAIAEIVKKAIQQWAQTDPLTVLQITAAGAVDTLLKVGQGVATPEEVQRATQLVPPQLQQGFLAALDSMQMQQQAAAVQAQQMGMPPTVPASIG